MSLLQSDSEDQQLVGNAGPAPHLTNQSLHLIKMPSCLLGHIEFGGAPSGPSEAQGRPSHGVNGTAFPVPFLHSTAGTWTWPRAWALGPWAGWATKRGCPWGSSARPSLSPGHWSPPSSDNLLVLSWVAAPVSHARPTPCICHHGGLGQRCHRHPWREVDVMVRTNGGEPFLGSRQAWPGRCLCLRAPGTWMGDGPLTPSPRALPLLLGVCPGDSPHCPLTQLHLPPCTSSPPQIKPARHRPISSSLAPLFLPPRSPGSPQPPPLDLHVLAASLPSPSTVHCELGQLPTPASWGPSRKPHPPEGKAHWVPSLLGPHLYRPPALPPHRAAGGSQALQAPPESGLACSVPPVCLCSC